MKKVPFRLEAVLNTKIAKENIMKQEFAKLQLELKKSEEILNCFKNELNKSGQITEKVSAINLLHQQYYRELLANKINAQHQEVFQKMELVEKSRERLLQIGKEKKAIEKLKKLHENVQGKMALNEQQKFLDEIAIISYGKK